MRATQFWILLLCSALVSILYFKEIFLSRAIIHAQHQLVDNRETADTAASFENAWKQLAIRIYQGSKTDPAMLDLLKSVNIQIHSGPPPGSAGATTTPGASAPIVPGPITLPQIPANAQPALPGNVPSASSKPLTVPSLPTHP